MSKKPNPILTRQRNAAKKAFKEKKWDVAIRNYTKALAHEDIPVDDQIELLEGRAAAYRKAGDRAAEAADLGALAALLKARQRATAEALAQRNAELAVINSVQEALAKKLDIQEIYDTLGDKLREVFDVETAFIAMLSEDQKLLHSLYYSDKSKKYDIEPRDAQLGITGYVVRNSAPVVYKNTAEAEKYGAIYYASPSSEKDLNESGVFVPIVLDQKLIGVMGIQSYKKDAFDENDLRLISTLSQSMSIALENARLFDETNQRNAELAVINSVQEALAKELDIQGIYDAVGHKIIELLDAQSLVIGTYDHEQTSARIRFMWEKGQRFTIDEPVPISGIMRYMLEKKESLVINEDYDSRAEELGGTTVGRGETPKSALFVPLMKGELVFGGVSIQNVERERAFSNSDVRLLETLAHTMSVALENARLFDETAQRNAELAVITSVQEALAKELDIQGIYDAVGDKIRDIFDAQAVLLSSADMEKDLQTLHYMYEKGKRHYPPPNKISGLMKHLARNGEPLMFNQNTAEQLTALGAIVPAGEDAKSAIFVPLKSGGKVTGLISLQNIDHENAFDENDLRLLTTLANSMSVALENARLFDETNQRNAELAIINSVGQALAEQLDFQAIIDLVGDRISEITKAPAVVISLYDPQSKRISHPYVSEDGERWGPDRVPIHEDRPDAVRQQVIDSRQPIMIQENLVETLKKMGVRTSFKDSRPPKSILTVPIMLGTNATGTVSLQDLEKEHAFNESDLRLISTITASMGVALENARLFEKTSRLLEESQHRAAELATINEVSHAIASELDLDSLIQLTGERMRQIFHADIAYVALMNRQTNLIEFLYTYGEEVAPLKPGEGLTGRILESGQPLLINREETWEETEKRLERIGVRAKSYLGVPIKVGLRSIGALSVQSTRQAGQFDEGDMDLLSTIAANVGTAIRNAQLYQETQQRASEMAALAEVGREISQELDLNTVLEQIANQAMTLLEGKTVTIRLLQEDGSLPAVVAIGENAEKHKKEVLKLGIGITGSVAQSGKAELLNNPLKDPRAVTVAGTDDQDDDAIIFAPLKSKAQVIGVMGVWRHKPQPGPFSQSDLDFTVGLSRQAAIAIQNARLFEEVERQKEYFEALFINNPAAIVTVDLDGTVMSWSPAAERLFGYTQEEAIGQEVDELVAIEDELQDEARSYTKRMTSLGRVQITARRNRKDGSYVDVEVLGLPVIVGGEQIGYVVIYHDISEIEKARRAAEQANQAKSTFLANMSHELRTPLNAIIGFTRIVKRKGSEILPEKQLDNLDKVLVSGEHLLGLINTVLDIAKIEAGRVEVTAARFDIEPLLDIVLTTAQPLVDQKKVRLEKSIQTDLGSIYNDQEKIKQILINLLSNAAKFTRQGSITIKASRKGDDLSLAVSDTGIGIPADKLGSIFEEFQQADTSTTREYGGTGLGLSISRSLARLLGGDLTVKSKMGKGSIFTLMVPCRYGEQPDMVSEDTETTIVPARKLEKGKPVVLVIDDNLDVVHLLEQNLEESGYQVVGALNGDEGVELARRHKPFAITLDIMMPHKDGWQVLHELKTNPETRDIPVIMISIVDKKAMGYRLGASDYLVKPLEEGAVLAALERLAHSNGGVPPKRVLVVDDDPQIVDMVSQLLEDSQYAVESAPDGQIALKLIEQQQPDAILLDLLMPRLDGFGVLEKLQENKSYRHIPVIVLTAKSLTAKETAVLEKRVSRIIQKQGLEGRALIRELQKAVAA